MNFPSDVLEMMRTSERAAVLTGSGISAESGIPTFRDAQTGLWSQYRPEDLATPQAFRRNPRLVWDWYSWRRRLVSQAEPNPAHYALAEMEKHFQTFFLLTQNVDNLHILAGSQRVIELHGNIFRTKCSREGVVVDQWEETGEKPPICPRCGSPLRPDVVWFGEALPVEALQAAFDAVRTSQLFFSIGTSGLVEPAASLPFLALQAGAFVVEINPEETPLTAAATYSLPGPSGTVLPALIQAAWVDL